MTVREKEQAMWSAIEVVARNQSLSPPVNNDEVAMETANGIF
jgi:hypothetical protein